MPLLSAAYFGVQAVRKTSEYKIIRKICGGECPQMELIEVNHARIRVGMRFFGIFLIQKNGWRFSYSLVRFIRGTHGFRFL